MSSFEITADIGEALSMFDSIGSAARGGLVRPVAQAGSQVLYDEVLRRVPVEKKPRKYKGKQVEIGLLKRSIYQVYSKDQSGESSAEYHIAWNHKKAPHGWLVEFGHGGPRPAPGKAFLRGAYESHAETAADAMAARLDTELDKLGV